MQKANKAEIEQRKCISAKFAQNKCAKQNSSSNQTAQIKQTTQPQAANVTALNAVYVVSAKGGGNFTSINEALRNVPANSRLLIREGLYQRINCA